MFGLKEEKILLFNMMDDTNGTTVSDTKIAADSDKSNGTLPNHRIQRGICWFHPPDVVFRPSWLTSIRGSENFHIYLWILKDLSWAQSWWISGHVFGIAAILWSFYILSHTVRDRNTNEIMTNFSTFMWLFGNTWWMIGDIHGAYPHDSQLLPIPSLISLLLYPSSQIIIFLKSQHGIHNVRLIVEISWLLRYVC